CVRSSRYNACLLNDLRLDWREGPSMRAACECGAIPQLSFNVRPIASTSVLGSFERRSALRKNRRLARAEITVEATVSAAVLNFARGTPATTAIRPRHNLARCDCRSYI